MYTGTPSHPLIANAAPPEEQAQPVPIRDIFKDYIATRRLVGSHKDNGKPQEPVVESLIKFVKYNDARRLTRREIIDWRDDLPKTLAPKTVSDVYLSAARSMLKWAKEIERLQENVAETVRQAKPKKIRAREKVYTTLEAAAILTMSRHYAPLVWINGAIR